MEINKSKLFKLEIATVNRNLFKQIRQWSAETLKEYKITDVLGWVDFEGVWVIIKIDSFNGVNRVRATDYVITVVDRDLWHDGVTSQVMNKFPQLFVV